MTSLSYDEWPRYEDEGEPVSHNPFEENHFDAQFATTVHVHVSTSSRDCDGPLYRDYVITPNEGESGAEFFARWMLSLCAYNPNVEVFLSEDGEWVGRYSQPTDEGYHAEEHRSCVDEYCRDAKTVVRDVYAEQMGY